MNRVGVSDVEFRERVRLAKLMTPEERLLESFRLTELEVEEWKKRLRKEFPKMTETEIICELRARRDEIDRAEMLGFTVINGRLKMVGDPPTSAQP